MAGKWKAPSSIEVSADPECDGQARFFRRRTIEVRRVSDEKQVPVAKSAAKVNCPTRRRRKQHKLAVVLGVFIICWLPFFITHILNVHCQRCYIPLALCSACAWLGYVINPIIYTTFNVVFCKTFMKTFCIADSGTGNDSGTGTDAESLATESQADQTMKLATDVSTPETRAFKYPRL